MTTTREKALTNARKGKPFHLLNDAEYAALVAKDAKWMDVAERHPQPSWCEYPGALEGVMGCWSLVGRMVTGKKYCHGCDCKKGAKS